MTEGNKARPGLGGGKQRWRNAEAEPQGLDSQMGEKGNLRPEGGSPREDSDAKCYITLDSSACPPNPASC